MFKQRVKDWDLQKNYKAAERRELAEIVTVVKYHEVMGEGGRPRKVMLRGQPVKMHKLRRDLRHQNLSSKRLAEFQDLAHEIRSIAGQDVSVEDLRKRLLITSTPTPPVATPQELKHTEIFLANVDIFYQSYTEAHTNPPYNQENIPKSRDYFNNCDVAFELIKTGATGKGLQLLNATCEFAQPMLESRCTETISNMVYQVADWVSSVPRDIFMSFFGFFTSMAVTVLGDTHPVAQICRAISGLEPGSPVYEVAFRIIVNRLQKNIGPTHREVFEARDRHGVLLCWRGNFADAERLHRELVDIQDAKDKYSHVALLTYYRLGRIMERSGNVAGAEDIYREVVTRRRISPGCKNCPSYNHSAMTLSYVELLMARGAYEESEQVLREVLDTALVDKLRIITALNTALIKLGKFEEAEVLRLQHPNAFWLPH